MAVRIARSTGGLSVAVNTAVPVAGGIVATVALGSHALSRKQAELVGILSDLMTLPKLEPARLREVARETFARMQTGLSFQTLSLAPLLAASPISDASAFLERSVGVTSFERLKALAAADASAFDEEAEVLGRLWRRLFSPERIQVVATAPDDALGELAGELAEVIAGLTGGTGNGSAPPARPPRHGGVARTLPMLVSTNAKVFPGPGYGHPDAPALAVLARLLQSRILHPEIREKGGAYGSRALADLDHETFELISYSDPNVARTHEVWRSLLGRLDGTSADDVRSAIIATSKELNPLLSPDMRGPAAWRNRALGRSTELRSQFRDAVLSVTLDHLRRVAETYLVEERASVATIGNADAIADANDRLQLFETVEPLI
jgi:Zn-dependent M16 (insulinase) family peptidase